MSTERFIEWFILRRPGDWRVEEVVREATIEFPEPTGFEDEFEQARR